MVKKLIAFDLDDTLAVSKSAISDEMSELFVRLLDHFDVCIISGGKYEQFTKQVVGRIEATPKQLSRLHLMPTCGTRYYRYEDISNVWQLQYAEDLTDAEKKKIIDISENKAKEAGLWPDSPFGEVIEDRNSQISISFLGQHAPVEEKEAWSQKYADKRLEVRQIIADELMEFEVRAGGTTTIDITRLGIDKAYGMQKLIESVDIAKDDILFVGDKLQEGGNDYPVKAMGIDCIEVSRWQDTAYVLRGLLSNV